MAAAGGPGAGDAAANHLLLLQPYETPATYVLTPYTTEDEMVPLA